MATTQPETGTAPAPLHTVCLQAELLVRQTRLHERVEPERLERLVPEVVARGMEKSVHVAATADGWLVVDGAHRTSAALQLGHVCLSAHVVSIPDHAPVPGWAMTLAAPLAPRALGHDVGTGDPIAVVRARDGRSWLIRSGATSMPGHRVAAMQRLADVVHAEPYRRLKPDASPPAACDLSLEWVLPTWGELSEGLRASGPLPAGVTRFGPLWAQTCPQSA